MRKTLQIRITGKVQGVWYRQSATKQASTLGITGWVRNEQDGSVVAVATGDSSALESFVQWCRTGPPGASVSGITIQELALQEFDSFMIQRV